MVVVQGNIKQEFEVGSAYEYMEMVTELCDEELEAFLDHERNRNEYEKLNEIIALEKAIFLHRRTPYSCGSITDSLRDVRNRLIIEYEKEFNKDYMNYNANIDW